MAGRGLPRPPWEALRVHRPQPQGSRRGGRPRGAEPRGFEGLLWSRWTGAQWREWPRRYGRPRPGWGRLQPGEEPGVLRQRWRACVAPLQDQQQRRGDAGVVDGRLVPAKHGGPTAAPPRGARARRGGCGALARRRRGAPPGPRRRRRTFPPGRRRATRSRWGARGTPAVPAHGPRAGAPSAARRAPPGERAWPGGDSTQAGPHAATTSAPPSQRGASGGATAAAGASNGRVPGGGTFAASSSGMSGG
jgi:transposase